MAVRKKKLTIVITAPPRLIVHFKTPHRRLRVHHIVRRQCLVADVSLISPSMSTNRFVRRRFNKQ